MKILKRNILIAWIVGIGILISLVALVEPQENMLVKEFHEVYKNGEITNFPIRLKESSYLNNGTGYRYQVWTLSEDSIIKKKISLGNRLSQSIPLNRDVLIVREKIQNYNVQSVEAAHIIK